MLKNILQKFKIYDTACIYAIYTSTALSDSIYIGKTKKTIKRRLSQHINYASKKNKNIYLFNWINKLLENKVMPEITELCVFDNISLFDFNKEEQFYIKTFKAFNYKLLNHTPGGDGGHGNGYIPNNKTKQKITNSVQLYYDRGGKSGAFGRHLTTEEKIHLSIINTGKKHSRETRLKLSLAQTGKQNGFYGKKHSAATKITLSESHSKLTAKQVKEIKHLIFNKKLTNKEIDDMFNVKANTISRIKSGKRWAHITIPVTEVLHEITG